mgnify:CR=1 FL=1
MKKFKNIIRNTGVIAALTLTVTACDLDQLPLNLVVLENYWTQKEDVQSSVNAAYAAFENSSVMERMFTWGEVRSDNVVGGSSITSNTHLNEILKGNLISTNGYADYTSFYNVINQCNTVIHYAPGVADKDPNFTESDLRQTMAEMVALRSLAYFYLIRTFKDVPYTEEASIDDNQNYVIAASSHDSILTALINHVETVQNQVPIRYSNEDDNYGRVTRNFMYSLLADMYLWRASDANASVANQQADYRKCVEYADKVIKAKVEQYNLDTYNNLKRQVSSDIYTNYGYPLLAETSSGGGQQSSGNTLSEAQAYNKIFGSGNSFESIFELQFGRNESQENSMVTSFFGNPSINNTSEMLSANDQIFAENPTSRYDNDNQDIFTTFDYRGLEFFRAQENGSLVTSKFYIMKYRANQIYAQAGQSMSSWKALYNNRIESYANWIIYRLTDVMLMKAEAEVQIAGYLSENAEPQDVDEQQDDDENEEGEDTANEGNEVKRRGVAYGNEYSTAEEYYDDAFNIVQAVYFRSCPSAGRDAIDRSVYTDKKVFEDLVETERRRELMFEGKRWYDLCRRARRENNMSHLSQLVSSKYTDNAAVMAKKFMIMDFMYWPYNKTQLQANELLKQNPAYNDEDKYVIN